MGGSQTVQLRGAKLAENDSDGLAGRGDEGIQDPPFGIIEAQPFQIPLENDNDHAGQNDQGTDEGQNRHLLPEQEIAQKAGHDRGKGIDQKGHPGANVFDSGH